MDYLTALQRVFTAMVNRDSFELQLALEDFLVLSKEQEIDSEASELCLFFLDEISEEEEEI